MKRIERTRNVNTTATTTAVTLNSATATTIAPANPDRIYLSVSLDEGTTTTEVFIRYYPAATDNIQQGEVIRRRLGSFLSEPHHMPEDNIYTGEVSGITATGTTTVYVTEY